MCCLGSARVSMLWRAQAVVWLELQHHLDFPHASSCLQNSLLACCLLAHHGTHKDVRLSVCVQMDFQHQGKYAMTQTSSALKVSELSLKISDEAKSPSILIEASIYIYLHIYVQNTQFGSCVLFISRCAHQFLFQGSERYFIVPVEDIFDLSTCFMAGHHMSAGHHMTAAAACETRPNLAV